MAKAPLWQYDEARHAGVDYTDPKVVAEYDEKHLRFRDYEKGTKEVVKVLGLTPGQTVIDMGCGTGGFAIHAAPFCKKIYAVDVSSAMLQRLREKADAAGLRNIECRPGGFLTYDHAAEPVDAVASIAALHHLPDFWKLVGLRRLADMLKPGGLMFLFDVVFPSSVKDHVPDFDEWIGDMETRVGREFAEEAVTHIRDEHSTWDWIMEGILEHAGFGIERKQLAPGFQATYLCRKNRS